MGVLGWLAQFLQFFNILEFALLHNQTNIDRKTNDC